MAIFQPHEYPKLTAIVQKFAIILLWLPSVIASTIPSVSTTAKSMELFSKA